MTARLKSSVLRREERGMGAISMARLIASGMAGGLVFMALRVLGAGILTIPGGIAGFILALILTHPRHGIPLYLHLYITNRARLQLQAMDEPHSLSATLAKGLDWHAQHLRLDAQHLFATPVTMDVLETWEDWEIVADSTEVAGFEVVTDTLSWES
jgi:hypothetical protein